jgi:hypothetical protein
VTRSRAIALALVLALVAGLGALAGRRVLRRRPHRTIAVVPSAVVENASPDAFGAAVAETTEHNGFRSR